MHFLKILNIAFPKYDKPFFLEINKDVMVLQNTNISETPSATFLTVIYQILVYNQICFYSP